MSDTSQGPGWWEATDGKWYPPERHPDHVPSAVSPDDPPGAPTDPSGEPGPPPGAPTTPSGSAPPAAAGPKSPPSRVTWLVLGAIGIVLVVVIVVMTGGGDDSPEPANPVEPEPSVPDAPDEGAGDEQAVNEIADAVVEGFATDDIAIERSQAVCVASTVVSALGAEQAGLVSDQMSDEDTILAEADARVVVQGYESCLPMRDLIRRGFADEGVAPEQADCLTDRTLEKLEDVLVLTLAGQFEELTALTAGDRQACGIG